jgi:hypothetical protein
MRKKTLKSCKHSLLADKHFSFLSYVRDEFHFESRRERLGPWRYTHCIDECTIPYRQTHGEAFVLSILIKREFFFLVLLGRTHSGFTMGRQIDTYYFGGLTKISIHCGQIKNLFKTECASFHAVIVTKDNG